jgi:putative FmdB family regulatory protein
MPNYTYQCENCHYQFDIHQDFSENSLTTCPECGKETLLKVYRPARIMFKGSGFYVNDNKSSSRNYLTEKKTAGENGVAGTNGSNDGNATSDATTASAKSEASKVDSSVAESK